MKRKILTGLAITLGIVPVILISTRIAGLWGAYKIPSPANEPALKVGSLVITTSFIKPVAYNFISFTSEMEDSILSPVMEDRKHSQYIYRLCGMPGDKLEMKNGILFVNNKNFDIDLNLKHQYKIANTTIDKIEQQDVYTNEYEPQLVKTNGDSVIITFDQGLKNKYRDKINLVPFFINDTSSQSGVFKWFNKNSSWTVDNFGPFRIPADSCFVLGDNRHNALDSRYTGYVSIKDITGVVFRKF